MLIGQFGMPNQDPPSKAEITSVGAETLQKAMALHQAGDLVNAEQAYRDVLRSKPDSLEALYYLGLLQAQRERYVEALSLFERALKIDPHSVDALIDQGNALAAVGRSREALVSYERALAIDPKQAMVHFNRGNLFRQLGRYAEALASYDAALSIMPDNVPALFNRSEVLQRLMRYEEALASYDRCLALGPDVPWAMYNRGVTLQQLGKHQEALGCYDKALELEPNDADVLNNRGNALFELNRFEEALTSYARALTVKPGFAEALNNRGNALRELMRLEEATASFKQALAINPKFAEAHNNLGHVLQTLGRTDEAIASFRRALELEPAFGDAHNNLGNMLRAQGRPVEAIACYRRAVELMPTSVEANVNLSGALHQLVPAWHIPMMNDESRNEAYVKALTAAITQDTHVLEIGTGSGLLAMIAARLGAPQVVTCEAVPLIAETARAIVAANGCEASVKIVPKLSKDLVVGVDLPQRANLLVSEILSSELLGEGVLASIEDAKRRLLEPGARIIPAMGSVVFALVGGDGIRKNMTVDEVLGFNLSGFNAIASTKRYIHRRDLDLDLFTDPAEAFLFDFAGRDYFPAERRTLRVPITAAGLCYGAAQWIRLKLDDNVMFENHPFAKTPASSWQICFYRFPAPIQVRPGQTARITAAHNRSAVWFFWEGLEG